MLARDYQRYGTSLARTAVVAIATLAILLVCFSLYQQSQLGPGAATGTRSMRMPAPGATSALPPPSGAASGVTVDGAVIGQSRNVSISLYPREGRDSKLELTVADWAPKEGSDHEFLLQQPEIRMRTAEGNDLRVKAEQGWLEARRKGGSGLQPQRGRLTGEVVIEFDRRTQEDKAKLPEAERNQVSDFDLVRVEAAALQFDVEFGRLIVPGKIHLTARDALLEAFDLEMHFDEQENRIQSLRIERGGRIELHSQAQGLNLGVPDTRGAAQKMTLVDWLRNTLQARIDAQATAQAESKPAENVADDVPHQDDGVPVFKMTKPQRQRTASRYTGRFEGQVDARQQIGDQTQSRLQADWLEIERELSLGDKKEEKKANKQTAGLGDASAPAAAEPPPQRIVLTWSGKLVVTDAPEVGQSDTRDKSKLTAGGDPARLSHPEGDAFCSRLVYRPDTGALELLGDAQSPVVVRAAEQGTVVGSSVLVKRDPEGINVDIAGPGRLWESGPTQNSSSSVDVEALGPPNITFASQLRATGRVVEKSIIDFTGSITTRQFRLLDRVDFEGPATLSQGETSLSARDIQVQFAALESWRGIHQAIDRVIGKGDVVMSQDDDRLTCNDIEIDMDVAQGKPYVKSALALGEVSATQGDRSLEAREKLIVEFDPPPTQGKAQLTSAPVAVPQPKSGAVASSSLQLGTSSLARRLRAFGGVTVFDPSQSLDLACDELDCALAGGDDIESAVLTGSEDKPASVKLETFSVTGKDITLDVPAQAADVPGEGRMTFQSGKDLDGRKVDQPIPIVVTWTEGMKYRGRENRATFTGTVHASSEASTTFDCRHLLVEFEEASESKKQQRGLLETWGLRRPLSNVIPMAKQSQPSVLEGYARELKYIEATGNAVAQTSEMFRGTSTMKSRARISGPKLSLHFASGLSKMLIEGPGDLLLEDFQPADASSGSSQALRADLFSDVSDAGPSKTLIKWRDRMWYDFGIDQTFFEGVVKLTHLSGAELDKVFGVADGCQPNTARGRRTFLDSDSLTVDFAESARAARIQADQRMGRISSDRLVRFRAAGRVVLREEVDRFSLTAEEVIYERPRKMLMIYGAPHRHAQLVRQRQGRLPDQLSADRIHYNLLTGNPEISKARITSGS